MATMADIQKIGLTWDKIALRLGLRRPTSELRTVLEPLSTRIISGYHADTATTASSQATGAVPAEIRVNLDPGMAKVNGVLDVSDPGVNVDLLLSEPPVLEVGEGVYGTVVFGVDMLGEPPYVSMVTVWAAPYTVATEDPVLPTRADILQALSDNSLSEHYARLFQYSFVRTGDTAITSFIDNLVRDA